MFSFFLLQKRFRYCSLVHICPSSELKLPLALIWSHQVVQYVQSVISDPLEEILVAFAAFCWIHAVYGFDLSHVAAVTALTGFAGFAGFIALAAGGGWLISGIVWWSFCTLLRHQVVWNDLNQILGEKNPVSQISETGHVCTPVKMKMNNLVTFRTFSSLPMLSSLVSPFEFDCSTNEDTNSIFKKTFVNPYLPNLHHLHSHLNHCHSLMSAQRKIR